jgi:WW domain
VRSVHSLVTSLILHVYVLSGRAAYREELNRKLGYPPPAPEVYALGKDEEAAVWWSWEGSDSDIIAWEVHRYRRCPNIYQHPWDYKGVLEFRELTKRQVIIPMLHNDFEYRFTVKARNEKGLGSESQPTNTVMVEKPLPAGWYRFYDKKKHRHYYANLRTKQSSWKRPESDPYFLEESVVFNFDKREIQNLKEMYDEEIAHFRHVSVQRLHSLLKECGEDVPMKRLSVLMKEVKHQVDGDQPVEGI